MIQEVFSFSFFFSSFFISFLISFLFSFPRMSKISNALNQGSSVPHLGLHLPHLAQLFYFEVSLFSFFSLSLSLSLSRSRSLSRSLSLSLSQSQSYSVTFSPFLSFRPLSSLSLSSSIIGYLSYCDTTSPNILQNLPNTPIVAFARFVLIIQVPFFSPYFLPFLFLSFFLLLMLKIQLTLALPLRYNVTRSTVYDEILVNFKHAFVLSPFPSPFPSLFFLFLIII